MIKLKITWRYCLAFYCIIMLYVSLHELVHHFAGYLVCGAWGKKHSTIFPLLAKMIPFLLLQHTQVRFLLF